MKHSPIRVTGLCLLISLIHMECSDSKKENNKNKKSIEKTIAPTVTAETLPIKETQASKYFLDSLKWERNKRTATSINKISKIEIISVKKEVDSAELDSKFLNPCKKWILNKKTIESVFRNSTPISGERWHNLYEDLPCYMKGDIKINDLLFKFEVNSGSHLVIWNADTSFRYGCIDKRFEKYFLSKEWDGKEE